MLVVTRKVGEKILIGEDVVIILVEIKSQHAVRLGVEAPRDVAIWRAELHPEKSQSVNSEIGNTGNGGASK